MGTHQPTTPVRPFTRRAASFVAAGAIPLSLVVIGVNPAAAEQPSGLLTAYGLVVLDTPAAASPAVASGADNADFAVANYAVAQAYKVVAATPITDSRPAPVALPVVPDNRIRIGDVQIDRPDWLDPEQGRQINEAAASAETAIAQALNSTGMEPARSDRIASDVVGTAAIGAAVGATVVSPVAATGAVIGAVAGLVAGLPFAPAGLFVITPVGAALGYAAIAVPAAVVGAAVGAAVGAVEGYLAPPIITEEQRPTL
ncbi:hypothetical protein [Nocardia sp. NPDC052566]|uniref:hypothetical protein n=1 Tax=Nocardia sp. NPDC052566 TaxID=3364330 RepID=UPI0037CBB107